MASELAEILKKLEVVVKDERYMSANDEFMALKGAVVKTDTTTLAQCVDQATTTWRFLAGFAQKKAMYRSHIVNIVSKLATVQSWCFAYASMHDLHSQVSTLHPDLQAAFGAAGARSTSEAEDTSALLPTRQHSQWKRSPGPCPDWAALEAVNRARNFGDAVDTFNTLAKAVTNPGVDVEDLEASSAHAGSTWEFLVGFALVKNVYRKHIVAVINVLVAVPSWRSALDARPDLLKQAESLHEDLQAALGLQRDSGIPSNIAAEIEHNEKPEPDNQLTVSASVADKLQTQPEQSMPPETQGNGLDLNEDSELRPIRPFLDTAADLEASEPLVAHYCRVHAVEVLMRNRGAGRSSSESRACLLRLLEEAEAGKQRLQRDFDLSTGQKTMEKFAVRAFDDAIGVDSAAGGATGLEARARRLERAAIYLDLLAQFHDGALPPSLAEASQYAHDRSGHILGCLLSSTVPEPPKPPRLTMSTTLTTGAKVVSGTSEAPASIQASQPPVQPPSRASAAQPSTMRPAAPAPAAVVAPAVLAMSTSKRKTEAKKRADLAANCVEADDHAGACKLIREALALLEGVG